jgi:hypothetical protein
MKSRQRQSGRKLVKPAFFVFCEGETEEIYVKYLRSLYRLPVEIDSKVAGNRITTQYIDNYKKQRTTHAKDKTFLIYDSDVESVLKKLQEMKNVNLLCSNPCFELWYLLHYENQTAKLTSEECVSKLKHSVTQYKKGSLDEKMKKKLYENKTDAISRAKALNEFNNPYTSIYKFVEELDNLNLIQ